MGKARETEAGLGILAGAGMLPVVQRHSSVPGSRCSENTGTEGKEKSEASHAKRGQLAVFSQSTRMRCCQDSEQVLFSAPRSVTN